MTEIEQLLTRIQEIYERRDAAELAELHHPNSRYPKFSGGFATGRDEIRDYLPTIFDAAPDDIESETVHREIEQVTEDLAIIDTHVRHTRKHNGHKQPASLEGFTTILVREKGQWLVAAVRGALVPKNSSL